MDREGKLIEKMGVHIESKEQIAPLAARIIASLVLKGKKGETFEGLVEQLCASKSTIFTHLTNLQASHRITYYTKPGDRKKYFILSPNALIIQMDEMIEGWREEREIHMEIAAYKSDINKNIENIDEQFDLDFHSMYMTYLEQASFLMQNLKSKLVENNKTNNCQ